MAFYDIKRRTSCLDIGVITMFAILETGGKQYKVAEGDVIEVELIDDGKITDDKKVNFDSVLLIKDEDLHVGHPYVENGLVQAKVLEQFKDSKVIIFKKKSKKGYRRTRGHRQNLHRIEIEKISMQGETVKSEEKSEEKVEKKTAPKKSVTKKAAAPKAEKTEKKAPAAKKTTTKKAAAKKVEKTEEKE